IKVDTGMNRLGCRSVEEIRNVYSLLTEKGCIIDGIFSHYTSSDCDRQQTLRQQETFRNMVKELPYTFRYVHMDNTDGAIDYPDDFTNAVRIGLGVYGVSTTRPLHPVLSFYTRVAMCKKVEANQTISYSCTYTTTEDEWICTLPVGYADGWLRKHQGRLCYIDGHYVPFVGRICMDQCMIHVPEKMKDGTVVELIGPHIPLVQVAKELDTIPYEILCTLSDRIVRTYTYNNEYISEELFRY
ncbi:MAG: alanine racemase, partial [Erysipelotrichaceae bacterium]|nr:alanine racemase [Erysipelotrichaceae bacterium]